MPHLTQQFSPRASSSSSLAAAEEEAADGSPSPCPCTDSILRDGKPIAGANQYVLPGEIINLSIKCPEHELKKFAWKIKGVIFIDWIASVNSAVLNYNVDTSKQTVTFCWANTGTQEVSVSFMADDIKCTKSVEFYVLKPTCVLTAVQGKTQLVGTDKVKLGATAASPKAGIRFTGSVAMPSRPAPLPAFQMGKWQFVQVGNIRPHGSTALPPFTKTVNNKFFTGTWCDVGYPYPSEDTTKPPPWDADGTVQHTNDSPEYQLSTTFPKFKTNSVDDYTMFIMFQPKNGRWVPLRYIDWEWSFCVSLEGNPAAWVLYDKNQDHKSSKETDEHPEWNDHLPFPPIVLDFTYKSQPPMKFCP